MAHQSGISVSDNLSAVFREALSGEHTRAIKVSIANERLEATATQAVQGTFEDDFAHLSQLLDATLPSYILVCFDTDDSLIAKWLLCTYVPDAAPVRAKMLYASSKASLTKCLGESYFSDEVFGTTMEEFSADGYRQHRRHVESGAPLTEREEEMQRVRDIESSAAEVPTMDTRRNHVSGATIALSSDAEQALAEYAAGSVNLVTLSFDIENEQFVLDRCESLQSHEELTKCLPVDSPRYVLYWYGSSTSLFVYSCPTTSSIRERMIFSSFKYGFLVTIKGMGIGFDVKLEIDNPTAELSAEALAEEVGARTAAVAANAHVTQPKFKRPAPPGRRPRTNNNS
ncbi:hypothetical protein BX661DRAFT_145996 [Kickxella alabastrina]|uniref:uncharacterized protein n=1 Tax=Kickxella alabastrina TaxID=61397 RepID=UPI00221FC2DF|nr:uncharacterized protein BX661DRAFT_145996 [Kickxella alabastrina]KAI7822286.1 hypothetical protein BX661DRAFT_145996 [Kickxella alabastrina]KAJ1946552.1 Twinfilin-1 [Kickxella alabastrina]